MFLRNAWYVAAWEREIGERPHGVTLLGEPVVIYRTTDGHYAAVEDACPSCAAAWFEPPAEGTVPGRTSISMGLVVYAVLSATTLIGPMVCRPTARGASTNEYVILLEVTPFIMLNSLDCDGPCTTRKPDMLDNCGVDASFASVICITSVIVSLRLSTFLSTVPLTVAAVALPANRPMPSVNIIQ